MREEVAGAERRAQADAASKIEQQSNYLNVLHIINEQTADAQIYDMGDDADDMDGVTIDQSKTIERFLVKQFCRSRSTRTSVEGGATVRERV